MLSDEDLMTATRASMTEAVAGIGDVDFVGSTRAGVRRRSFRRKGLAAVGAAMVVAAAVALPLTLGSSRSHGEPSAAPRAGLGTAFSLENITLALPPSYHVTSRTKTTTRAVSSTGSVDYTLLSPAPPPPAGAAQVQIRRSNNFWYLASPVGNRFYVYFSFNGVKVAIVITSTAMDLPQMEALVEHHGIMAIGTKPIGSVP